MTSKQGTQARRWCWTLNNYTEVEIVNIQKAAESECVRYVVFGKETAPETKTPHLQGYTEFKSAQRIVQIKKLFATDRIHLEACKGTALENIKYCKKEGNFWEHGTAAKSQNEKYEALVNECKISDIPTITEKFPEETIKNRNAVMATIDMFAMKRRTDAVCEKIKKLKPHPWQQKILDDCDKEPDDRKVNWIVDPAGGGGKTTLIKMLIAKYGLDKVLWITGGDTKSIAHAWKGERIVCFNYSRSLEEAVNYNAIESIKDGLIFSPKFDSGKKLFESPHLIVMSNFEPDQRKLTADRWNITRLEPSAPPPYSLPIINMDFPILKGN